jgi:hypothetical protein
LQDPRVNIAGIRRADLLALLDRLSPDQLSRQLRRLRDIGVIKRVAGTYQGNRIWNFLDMRIGACPIRTLWILPPARQFRSVLWTSLSPPLKD